MSTKLLNAKNHSRRLYNRNDFSADYVFREYCIFCKLLYENKTFIMKRKWKTLCFAKNMIYNKMKITLILITLRMFNELNIRD